MKLAIYYRPGWKPKGMFVLAENEDGTVDLAAEADGPAVVTSCPLGDFAGQGISFALLDEAPPVIKVTKARPAPAPPADDSAPAPAKKKAAPRRRKTSG